MTDSPKLTAPESLPKYLAEGIPKQDNSTLRDIQEYAQALINHREQAIDPADLPDSAEPVTDSEQGTVVLEQTKCGDETCHCAEENGELHGPYLYRYNFDGDSVSSEYIGKPEDHPEIETA